MNYLQRIKFQALEGFRIGTKHYFLLSLLFEVLLNIVVIGIIFFSFGKSNIAISFPFLESFIVINLTIWLWLVIPITTIGAVGGALTGFVLGFPGKRVLNILASSIGTFIGFVLILLANYLYWLMGSKNFHNHYSFLNYLIPLSTPKDVYQYYLFVNPFFIPSVILVLLWPYVGWRINKSKVLESGQL